MRPAGLEPALSSSAGKRFIQLNYGRLTTTIITKIPYYYNDPPLFLHPWGVKMGGVERIVQVLEYIHIIGYNDT